MYGTTYLSFKLELELCCRWLVWLTRGQESGDTLNIVLGGKFKSFQSRADLSHERFDRRRFVSVEKVVREFLQCFAQTCHPSGSDVFPMCPRHTRHCLARAMRASNYGR